MFENMTYEFLLQRMLDRVPDVFDKREGSMMYNALAPSAAEMAEAYIMMDIIYDETYVDTTSYNGLVKKCKERGMTPYPATRAIVKGEFNIDVPIGSRFSLDDLNYVVKEKITTNVFKLECEDTGPIFNLGNLIPIDYIDGLETARLTEVLINGENEEDDESLRKRYYDSLDGEAFGGNIPDYKEKVNKLQDVGGVKVEPTWNGGGTVKLVIIDSNYDVPSGEVVNAVQEAMDPIGNQGVGVGLAPIGHTVTVVGVNQTIININTNITYEVGWNFNELRPVIEKTIDQYFRDLNKNWENVDNLIVRISQLETRLLDIEGVLDIENTTLNGLASNCTVDRYSIAKRGGFVG